MTDQNKEILLGILIMVLGGMVIFNGVHYPQYPTFPSIVIGVVHFIVGSMWLIKF